jgi:hypothetical protein
MQPHQREGIENAIMQLGDALEYEDWQIVENVISYDLEPLLGKTTSK